MKLFSMASILFYHINLISIKIPQYIACEQCTSSIHLSPCCHMFVRVMCVCSVCVCMSDWGVYACICACICVCCVIVGISLGLLNEISCFRGNWGEGLKPFFFNFIDLNGRFF